MRTLWQTLTVCLLVVAAGPTLHAQVTTKNAEVLFVYPPDGWKLGFETKVSNIRFYEYVPAKESVDDWSQMVTVQILEGATDLEPSDIARRIRTRFISECGAVKHRGPERIKVNGFLAARLYVECDDPIGERRPGGAKAEKHEVAAFQIVQGRQDLYIIERAWHGPSRSHPGAPYGRTDLWGWDGFLHQIEVCDSARRDNPCFGLGLLSAEKAAVFVSRVDPVLPYGCDYFRVLTLLPDLAKPARPTMVVPVKLGLGPFGDSKSERAFVGELLNAYRENRPAAIILTLSRRALARIFPTDFNKTARDSTALRTLLTQGGVDPARIHETINPACPGS